MIPVRKDSSIANLEVAISQVGDDHHQLTTHNKYNPETLESYRAMEQEFLSIECDGDTIRYESELGMRLTASASLSSTLPLV